MTQGDLARTLHVTQAAISDIERGKTAVSDLVLPICRALEIAPPTLDADEEDATGFAARWNRVGALLHAQSPEAAETIAILVEALTKKS